MGMHRHPQWDERCNRVARISDAQMRGQVTLSEALVENGHYMLAWRGISEAPADPRDCPCIECHQRFLTAVA